MFRALKKIIIGTNELTPSQREFIANEYKATIQPVFAEANEILNNFVDHLNFIIKCDLVLDYANTGRLMRKIACDPIFKKVALAVKNFTNVVLKQDTKKLVKLSEYEQSIGNKWIIDAENYTKPTWENFISIIRRNLKEVKDEIDLQTTNKIGTFLLSTRKGYSQ